MIAPPPPPAAPLDYRAFEKSRRGTGTAPPAAWLAGFEPLLVQGRKNTRAHVTTVIVMVMALIIGAIAFAFIGSVGALAVLVMLLALVIGIGALVALTRIGPTSLPPNLEQFTMPLLAVLREELDTNQPVTLHLDLNNATQGQTRQGAPRQYKQGAKSIVEQRFVHRWLVGSTELADGARLSWQCTDSVRQRTGTWKNRRGKRKQKSKHRIKRQIVVRLGLPRKRYSAATAPAPSLQRDLRLKVRSGAKRDVICVRRTLIANDLKAPLPIDQFLALVGEAYTQARPATTGAEGGHR